MHKKSSVTRLEPHNEQNAIGILTCIAGLFWFLADPVAKFGAIVIKIAWYAQDITIFDICSVFLKILIFVALMSDFHVGQVRPAAYLLATNCPWKPPHKLFSGFFSR